MNISVIYAGWREIVEKDCQCQACKLNRENAVECNKWRKQIRDD